MAEIIKSKQNGKTRAQLIMIFIIVYPGNMNESQISDGLRYMLQ